VQQNKIISMIKIQHNKRKIGIASIFQLNFIQDTVKSLCNVVHNQIKELAILQML